MFKEGQGVQWIFVQTPQAVRVRDVMKDGDLVEDSIEVLGLQVQVTLGLYWGTVQRINQMPTAQPRRKATVRPFSQRQDDHFCLQTLTEPLQTQNRTAVRFHCFSMVCAHGHIGLDGNMFGEPLEPFNGFGPIFVRELDAI